MPGAVTSASGSGTPAEPGQPGPAGRSGSSPGVVAGRSRGRHAHPGLGPVVDRRVGAGRVGPRHRDGRTASAAAGTVAAVGSGDGAVRSAVTPRPAAAGQPPSSEHAGRRASRPARPVTGCLQDPRRRPSRAPAGRRPRRRCRPRRRARRGPAAGPAPRPAPAGRAAPRAAAAAAGVVGEVAAARRRPAGRRPAPTRRTGEGSRAVPSTVARQPAVLGVGQHEQPARRPGRTRACDSTCPAGSTAAGGGGTVGLDHRCARRQHPDPAGRVVDPPEHGRRAGR